jgi:hypothetical protein
VVCEHCSDRTKPGLFTLLWIFIQRSSSRRSPNGKGKCVEIYKGSEQRVLAASIHDGSTHATDCACTLTLCYISRDTEAHSVSRPERFPRGRHRWCLKRMNLSVMEQPRGVQSGVHCSAIPMVLMHALLCLRCCMLACGAACLPAIEAAKSWQPKPLHG